MSPIAASTTVFVGTAFITCCKVAAKFSTMTISLGARVLQLVLEFARRVQRVDVDHHVARAQDRRHRHRVLRHVGHHDRDAVAARQALRLQPGCEGARQVIDLAKRDRAAHELVGRQVAVLAKALLEQRHQRRVQVDSHLGRYAGRVMLEPDLVHRTLPGVERRFWRRMEGARIRGFDSGCVRRRVSRAPSAAAVGRGVVDHRRLRQGRRSRPGPEYHSGQPPYRQNRALNCTPQERGSLTKPVKLLKSMPPTTRIWLQRTLDFPARGFE